MVSAHVTTRVLGDRDFPAPIDDRWWEDYEPGAVYEYGHLEVTEDDVVEFATRYDPQSIHTEPGWAASGPFGGLIASGVHSLALASRLMCDHYISAVASLASPGMDEIRWTAPLRPGDAVRLRVAVTDARPSRSRGDRGMVFSSSELLAHDGRCPVSFRTMNIMAKRPAG